MTAPRPAAARRLRALATAAPGPRANGRLISDAPIRSRDGPLERGRGDGFGDARERGLPRRSGLDRTRGLDRAQRRLLMARGCAVASRRPARPARRRRKAAAGFGHQRGKLLQRADLVGNDPPHRLGGLARLLRQIEHAATQLLPGLVEFTLNLARHVLHFRDRLTEAVGGVIERAGQLRVGLLDGRLQRLGGSLALLGGRVANGLELAGDRNRRASCGGGERGADLLGARLRPVEAVLDVGREAPERRLEGLAAAREVADERLKAVVAALEREIERLLLAREIPSDRGERFRVLGELRGERARVGLGRGRKPPQSGDLGGDAAERVLEFLDPRGKPALDGRQPVAGRPDRLVDDGAGLAEIVDHGRQFVAQPVAGAGEASTELSALRVTVSRNEALDASTCSVNRFSKASIVSAERLVASAATLRSASLESATSERNCPVSALRARTGSAALPLTAAMSSSVRRVSSAARPAICWSSACIARSPTPAILADTSSPLSPSAVTRSAPLPSMTSRKSSTFARIAPATLAPRAAQIDFGLRRRPRQDFAHRLNASDEPLVDGPGVAIGRLRHVRQPHVDDPRALVRGLGQGGEARVEDLRALSGGVGDDDLVRVSKAAPIEALCKSSIAVTSRACSPTLSSSSARLESKRRLRSCIGVTTCSLNWSTLTPSERETSSTRPVNVALMSRATVDSVCVSSSARLCSVSPISADLALMPCVISRPPSPSALAVSRVLRARVSDSARPRWASASSIRARRPSSVEDTSRSFAPARSSTACRRLVEQRRRLLVSLAELLVDRAAAVDESLLDGRELGAEIGGESRGPIADLAR